MYTHAHIDGRVAAAAAIFHCVCLYGANGDDSLSRIKLYIQQLNIQRSTFESSAQGIQYTTHTLDACGIAVTVPMYMYIVHMNICNASKQRKKCVDRYVIYTIVCCFVWFMFSFVFIFFCYNSFPSLQY